MASGRTEIPSMSVSNAHAFKSYAYCFSFHEHLVNDNGAEDARQTSRSMKSPLVLPHSSQEEKQPHLVSVSWSCLHRVLHTRWLHRSGRHWPKVRVWVGPCSSEGSREEALLASGGQWQPRHSLACSRVMPSPYKVRVWGYRHVWILYTIKPTTPFMNGPFLCE